jgi:Arc/MetJ-type ribon-helix-helix transcriptional regulator
MNVEISPSSDAFLTDAISRGLYKDRKSALDDAVELLRRRQEILDRIERGTEQLRTGDFLSFDEEGLRAYGEEIKRQGRERLNRES